MIGIYKITNKLNGKSYIGQSVHCCERLEQHLKGDSQFIDSVIQVDGIENFTFEILKQTNKENLSYWEDYYIMKYDTMFPKGYNKRWNCNKDLRQQIKQELEENKGENNKKVEEKSNQFESVIKEKVYYPTPEERLDRLDEYVYKICLEIDKVQKRKLQKYFLSIEEISELIKRMANEEYTSEQIIFSFEKLKKRKFIDVEIQGDEIFYFKILYANLNCDWAYTINTGININKCKNFSKTEYSYLRNMVDLIEVFNNKTKLRELKSFPYRDENGEICVSFFPTSYNDNNVTFRLAMVRKNDKRLDMLYNLFTKINFNKDCFKFYSKNKEIPLDEVLYKKFKDIDIIRVYADLNKEDEDNCLIFNDSENLKRQSLKLYIYLVCHANLEYDYKCEQYYRIFKQREIVLTEIKNSINMDQETIKKYWEKLEEAGLLSPAQEGFVEDHNVSFKERWKNRNKNKELYYNFSGLKNFEIIPKNTLLLLNEKYCFSELTIKIYLILLSFQRNNNNKITLQHIREELGFTSELKTNKNIKESLLALRDVGLLDFIEENQKNLKGATIPSFNIIEVKYYLKDKI